MNKTQLLGRLTKDIDLRYTQNQTAIGRFTLAVPRIKKEDGSDFIACKVWGKRAETMEKFIKKGHKVCIAGRLETGAYEKDGHKVYTTEVVVEDFDFIETSGKSKNQPDEQKPTGNTDGFDPYPDDDLPF